MFRKIHSNRNPQNTLLSELRTQFSPQIERCSKKITQKMKNHPKLIFRTMIICMFLSAGLSFTFFRNKDQVVKKPKVNVITDGFEQITTTANAIQQTISLKQQIDSLSAKRALTNQDSATLERDLDQLRQLQQKQKP
jgi:hypothetical protein